MDEPDGYVYFVIIEPGGLFATYLDEQTADKHARFVEGVLARAPRLADYRPKGQPHSTTS